MMRQASLVRDVASETRRCINSRMSVRAAMLRALVLTAVAFSAGVFLYWSMGVTLLSAVLFALACGVGSVLAGFVD